MLPVPLLSKLGNYEVEVHGVKVKVSVVEDGRLIREKISELRGFLNSQAPVMGLDVKPGSSCAQMVLVCAGCRCLIVPGLKEAYNYIPVRGAVTERRVQELEHLLADDTIGFVGMRLKLKLSKTLHCRKFKIGADLGDLAAKVLKKPNLATWGLAELASEVGFDIKPVEDTSLGGTCVVPDWNATVFSDEQIKYAIHDVYASYLIGKKFLAML
ncbi:unnamed protein product [Malus baccata var. baccata]